ncbi:hypothetical protein [Actinomadura rubrisoli]|uniref:Uncharacterized protein n=1 Tax=Actinomadura rubrisoli TaxID=2530368 RepID=A0A4R5ADK5_9ACTN|nr:hypothetical protein [Actinomadura rubrisoli]TDD69785.1 hypothetical protein E1298_37160 [Actinomadura rubrisoli]
MGKYPGKDSDLTLTFHTKDPDSGHGKECETFYTTDLESWIVQGKKRGPNVRAQLANLAEDETFLEISDRTMAAFVQRYVKERYGIDLN